MTGKKILVVEDEAIVAKNIEKGLESLGYVVPAIAFSGERAIQLAAENRPDLVLMDIRLQGEMDGMEAAEQIRACFDIPVVYLTAYADNSTLEKAKATEPFGYIAKPFDLKDVFGTIEMSLYRHKMEQRLKESEERHRILAELVSDFAYAVRVESNDSLQLEWATDAITRITGYTLEEAYAPDSWQRIVHPDDMGIALEHLQRHLSGHSDISEYRILTKAGEVRWIRDFGRPVWDETEERVARIYGAAQDITRQKLAEEALHLHSHELEVLNRAGQALSSTLDLDRVLVTVMEEVSSLLGVVASSVWLLDRETDELVCWQATGPQAEATRGWRLPRGEGLAGWVAARGESLIVTDTQTDARHFKDVDRTTGMALRSILTVPLQTEQEVIGVLQMADQQVGRFDSSQLPLVELLASSAAIAIENARLYERAQREIAERKHAEEVLRQRTAELEARNEELDAYAHTVAHDLQNPLAVLIGIAEALQEELPFISGEELEEHLRTMTKSGRKMQNIINELLLLASVRQKGVKTEPLDMADVLLAAQLRLTGLIKQYHAEFVLPSNWPIARGYGPWVEEVWANYLSNAIRHGGRPPRIELGAQAETGGIVRFWVHDNGPGLAPEEQAGLFAPFTKLDRAGTEGQGLGLSIVRRIIEKLGGEVGIESSGVPGQGSTFYFTLPAADAEANH